MSRSLALSYQSATARYQRLTKKIRKSVNRGEFWRYTRRKRNHLLHKLENLKRRLSELTTQLKLAGAGLAMAAILTAGDASAQATKIGPFVRAPEKNPLPPPAFSKVRTPTTTLVDFDGDGDLDAINGGRFGDPLGYLNVGTKNRPVFEEAYYYEMFGFDLDDVSDGANSVRTTFADLDDDGDLDMIIAQRHTNNSGDPQPIYFFENQAEPGAIAHFVHPDTNPFESINVQEEAWPAFTDIDGDGDKDLVLAGLYNDKDTGENAFMQVFRNNKEGNAPGEFPSFTPLTADENPLYIPHGDLLYLSIAFADIDKDGDDDFIYASNFESPVGYRRNDGGKFVEQEGPWTYNAQNPGASTGNPFLLDELNKGSEFSGYRSFAFGDLDGDGDLDLVVGLEVANRSSAESSFIYIENTGNGVFKYDASKPNAIEGITAGYEANSFFYDYDKDGDKDIVGVGTIISGSGCNQDGCETGDTNLVPTILFNNNNVYTRGGIMLNPFPNDLPEYSTANVADVDGDGDFDFTVSSSEWVDHDILGRVDYYENVDGTLVARTGAANPFEFVIENGLDYTLLTFGDLNADGLPDMILTGNNAVHAYKNTGTLGKPSFAQEEAWDGDYESSPYGAGRARLVDLDNDGDLDIILGKYEAMWYYENQGTKAEPKFHLWTQHWGDETPPELYEGNPLSQFSGYGSYTPNFADLDGDGDFDMLYSGYSGTFGYYENQNPAPAVVSTRATMVLLPGAPIVLDNQMTISDSDGDKMARIVVSVSPFEPGRDVLRLGGSHPNLQAQYADTTGILTITPINSGTALIADFQAALRAVEYEFIETGNNDRKGRRNSSSNGRTINKEITFKSLDADLTVAPSNTTTFTVIHTNETPAITPSVSSVVYSGTSVVVLATASVSDADDLVLASAKIFFANGSYVAASDRLEYSVTGGLAGSFDTATGTFTFTGVGTLQDYENALRLVRFNSLDPNATGTRVLSITINDGEHESNIAQVTINLPKAPPVITGTANTFYINGEVVVNNNILLTDVDDLNLVGGSVVISGGLNPSEDVLAFTDQDGITGTYAANTGTLTLAGTSSIANYQAALRSVRYRNTSTTPSIANRLIQFSVTDGGNPVTLSGSVITINKPPVIAAEDKQTAAGGNIAFNAGSILSDPDNNLDVSTLVVTSQQGAQVSVNNGIITVNYNSIPEYLGTDVITITVCDTGGRCNTTTYTVEVGAEAVIYSGMSPNGDGVNDAFYIQFLPKGTQVAVYNRWGDAIFETNDYDNNEAERRFEGKNKNGTDVVAGSYFYKIRFADGRVKTGYLLLNR